MNSFRAEYIKRFKSHTVYYLDFCSIFLEVLSIYIVYYLDFCSISLEDLSLYILFSVYYVDFCSIFLEVLSLSVSVGVSLSLSLSLSLYRVAVIIVKGKKEKEKKKGVWQVSYMCLIYFNTTWDQENTWSYILTVLDTLKIILPFTLHTLWMKEINDNVFYECGNFLRPNHATPKPSLLLSSSL